MRIDFRSVLITSDTAIMGGVPFRHTKHSLNPPSPHLAALLQPQHHTPRLHTPTASGRSVACPAGPSGVSELQLGVKALH